MRIRETQPVCGGLSSDLWAWLRQRRQNVPDNRRRRSSSTASLPRWECQEELQNEEPWTGPWSGVLSCSPKLSVILLRMQTSVNDQTFL